MWAIIPKGQLCSIFLILRPQIPDFEFPRFNGVVRAIVPDGQGGWYVGGAFNQINGQSASRPGSRIAQPHD